MVRPLPEEYAEIESLYRTAPVALGLIDRDFRFVRINERLAAINGPSVAAHIGRTIRDIVPDLAPVLEEIYGRVFTTGKPVVDLLVHGTTPAEPSVERDWLASYYPVFEADGTVSGVSAVVQDVTERSRAEDALRRSHRRMQEIIDSMFAFVGVLSADGIVLSANRAPLEATGLGAGDVIGRHLTEIYSLSYSRDVQERIRAAIRRAGLGEVVRYDEEVLVSDGARLWLDIMFSPLRDEHGRVVEIVASATDITERKRATDALMQAGERLHHLSRRLLEIQETERRALARELHDEIGQALTAVRINLHAVEASELPAADARLKDVSALVERAIAQVRSLSLALRPPMLDDFGLSPALRWLVDQQAPRSGAFVTLDIDDIARLEPAVEIACFRVAQEALNNVFKHAGARCVTLEARHADGTLRLRVTDDGRGFDVAAARARATVGGSLGLLGIEERVGLAGGGVKWRSGDAGTEVRAWFPATPLGRP